LIDGIAAIVGEHVILKSDLAQIVQMTAVEQRLDPRLDVDKLEKIQFQVLESLINQKLILEIAEVESIEVEDREVDQAVEQYIAQSVGQAGSEERLESILGKRLSELRREWWPDMKEQLVAERYQGQLFSDVDITREEVFVFYNNYKDSLKAVPTVYSSSHIFFKARPGGKSRSGARFLLDSLRREILSGSDFAHLAAIYSEDPGSAKRGGELGFVNRGTLVPAFEQAAYTLGPGEVSPLIETEFGYHIIETVESLGDKINARHILITPKVSSVDEDSVYALALSVRDSVGSEEGLFAVMAKRHSDDASTGDSGGRLGWVDPERFPIEAIAKVLPAVEVGTCSPPINTDDGFHLLYVHEKREGGLPTLETHWAEIEGLSLARKKTKRFKHWLKNASSTIYVENFLNKR
jgi:peptidyl-prolyl cis-trans isomerase SurA